MVCPTVLWPFPIEQLRLALSGVTRLVCVENNATGQLATVLSRFAMKVDRSVHKYDGRPFSVDELEAACRKAL
jgi:2-oxoglutarate ferredoxin oxidoreductase subunit alpha